MQTSLPHSQSSSPKATAVKNILIRHSCSKEIRYSKNYEHPEISHLFKYAPKYYHSFTAHFETSRPIFSKIKKIKKLKTFTGYFSRGLSHQIWLNILANNRKEIDEIPYIAAVASDISDIEVSESFWKRLDFQQVKFFPNLRKISLSTIFQRHSDDSDSFLSIKSILVKYIWNMRRLKSVEMTSRNLSDQEIERLLQKFDKMPTLLARLDNFAIEFWSGRHNGYSKVLSHLTSLKLQTRLNQVNDETLQVYKNLRSLSISSSNDLPEKPEFQNFLSSIQHLSQLKSLNFNIPRNRAQFWEYFKPQSSLRSLKIRFLVSGEIQKELPIKQWEEMTELDSLHLAISYAKAEELHFVTAIITMILKKIRKLRSLKLEMKSEMEYYVFYSKFEPFLVQEIPHLYESLERFEFSVSTRLSTFPEFDFKTLKPFCNLKVLKFEEHSGNSFKDLKSAVNLLQENQKNSDFPVLEITRRGMSDEDDMEDFLMKITKNKRIDKNLKIVLNLLFDFCHLECMVLFEMVCKALHAVKRVRGLIVNLDACTAGSYNYIFPSIEQAREIVDKYPGIRNLNMSLREGFYTLEFIKLEGQKSQLYFD